MFTMEPPVDLERIVRTEPALLGERRTFQTINHFEKVFIILTLLDLTVNLGFVVYRLSTLDPISSVFTMSLLLLLNIVFCYFYLAHGILYEQPYEIFILVISTISILGYTILTFIAPKDKDSIKMGRLAFTVVMSPLVAVCGLLLSTRYHASGNLVFRLVGADQGMQSICRKLQRATVLNVFDAQALLSCLLLIIRGTNASIGKTAQFIILGCGIVFTIIWSIIGFIGMHREKPVLIWIFLLISPVQPAYVLWQIIQTGLYESGGMLEIAVYISGALLLLIHVYLFVNTVQVYRNFGKGLRERARATSAFNRTTNYGSTAYIRI